MAHPDSDRVGDRARLIDLPAQRAAALSRLEPLFVSDRGAVGPLADPYISRSPVWVRLTAGALVLDATGTSTALAMDGQPVTGSATWPLTALEEGVTLTLGERVAVLLHLTTEPGQPHGSLGLVGGSDALRALRADVARVALADGAVLIRGETGTGKELVARALHDSSRRRGARYVAVNMATLAPATAAAELFGHKRGAFTGATQDRIGLFREADGGTLLLDEVGEAPQDVQPMLLRALESGEIRPLGADGPVRVDVRVIAATDAGLEQAIDAGRFRAPLLHRLAAHTVNVPPLRARRDDIGLLLLHFLRRELAAFGAAHRLEPPPRGADPWLPASLVAALACRSWPGNVRELANVARLIALLGHDAPTVPAGEVLARMAPGVPGEGAEAPAGAGAAGSGGRQAGQRPLDGPATPGSVAPPRAATLDDAALLAALRRNGWATRATARDLGISRTTLYARMERCEGVRKARDVTRAELVEALTTAGGSLAAAAAALEVSPRGLTNRARELGLTAGADGDGDGADD